MPITQPFVLVALKVQDELHIMDSHGKAMTMRFAKLYSPEKMGAILQAAKSLPWHESNPTVAFMTAIGIVNRKEKSGVT